MTQVPVNCQFHQLLVTTLSVFSRLIGSLLYVIHSQLKKKFLESVNRTEDVSCESNRTAVIPSGETDITVDVGFVNLTLVAGVFPVHYRTAGGDDCTFYVSVTTGI